MNIENNSKRNFLSFIWPTLTLIPVAAFSLALILLFWTQPGQIMESLKIGGTIGWPLPLLALLPMMIVGVAHTLFLMHVRKGIRPTTAQAIAFTPWLILVVFWVWLDGGSMLLAPFIYVFPTAAATWVILKCEANISKAFHLSIATVVVLLMVHIAFTHIQPVVFPRFIGAVPLIVNGLGILSVILFAFFIFKTKSWWVFTGLAAILIFLSPTHDVRSIKANDEVPPQLQQGFTEWLESRPDLDAYRSAKKPYPVIITSAEGGGITAAGHAYFTLMGLQDNCPMFAQHVFASVGVSGGSYGTALFGSKTQSVEDRSEVIPCRPSTTQIKADGIGNDHFAPVVASFLFMDIPNAIIPFVEPFGPTRAESLELSFEELDAKDKEFMRLPIESSWKSDGNTPAMVFVSTQVTTGDRFQIAPIVRTSGWFLPTDNSVRVSSAVGASARFPWITPSAALVEGKNRRNLVDGGYFENTGADAAMELVRVLWNAGNSNDGGVWKLQNNCNISPQKFFTNEIEWGCNIPIHVTYLAISDVDTSHPDYVASSEKQSFLLDPLSTMLATRTARGTLALDNARYLFCERLECAKGAGLNAGFQEANLPSVNMKLPLGWSLSSDSVDALRKFSVSMDDCDALERKANPTLPDADHVRGKRSDPPTAKNYNGCHLATISSLFNLDSSNSDYYGIEGYGYEFQ